MVGTIFIIKNLLYLLESANFSPFNKFYSSLCINSFIHSKYLLCSYSVPEPVLGKADYKCDPCLHGTNRVSRH